MSLLGLEEEGYGGDMRTEEEKLRERLTVQKDADTIFYLSLLSILFCCAGGFAATYCAYQARQDARAGNIDGARSNTQNAKIFMIISFVIGGMSIVNSLVGLLDVWLDGLK